MRSSDHQSLHTCFKLQAVKWGSGGETCYKVALNRWAANGLCKATMVAAIMWPPLKAWHDIIRPSEHLTNTILWSFTPNRLPGAQLWVLTWWISNCDFNLIYADNKRKHTRPLGRLKSGGTFPRWILLMVNITLMICSSSSHLLSRFQTQRLFHTEGMCLTWLHWNVYIYGPRGLKWSISHQSLTPDL